MSGGATDIALVSTDLHVVEPPKGCFHDHIDRNSLTAVDQAAGEDNSSRAAETTPAE